MEITYLIGNGFDLNLGLRTKYIHFAKEYALSEDEDTYYVNRLKKSINSFYCINEDEDQDPDINWGDMEKGFGDFSGSFAGVENGDEELENCHKHLCASLALYLEREEERFNKKNIDTDSKVLAKLGKAFLDYTKGLQPVEAAGINDTISRIGGAFNVRILDFNYTTILDAIQSCISKGNHLGVRIFNNTKHQNNMYEVLHVHGTTKHGMIFGVNDENQLADPSIFKEDEPERKSRLIKADVNNAMGERMEERATEIIQCSNLIYVYGMSLGETDKRWWERILAHMKDDSKMILILHDINAPVDERDPFPLKKYQRTKKEKFIQFLPELENEQRDSIKRRIYVTGNNIFCCLKDYTNALYLPS